MPPEKGLPKVTARTLHRESWNEESPADLLISSSGFRRKEQKEVEPNVQDLLANNIRS